MSSDIFIITRNSSNFIFNFTNVYVIFRFFNKLQGILFSSSLRSVVIAKLVILGILFLTLFILALRAVVVVAKFAISGILYATFLS